MFCAYNDYLHITAKTLPSYRIKDGSDIASSTCRNPRYCSLIFVVRTDKGRTINSASTTCKIGNSVCKYCFSANGLQTVLQTEMDITICVPILSYMIFYLQIFVFNQIFSCSMILSLSPLPFVDSRSNGRE